MDVLIAWLPRLSQAALLTVGLFLVVLALSTSAGLAMALGERLPGGRVAARAFGVFSWAFRGTPELVVLLACYLGLPRLGVDLGPVGSAILGFALVGAAYDYQVFRGALAAVPEGQYEAARALGLRPLPVMLLVVLPQVLRIAIGPWITYATGAVKRLSIASAIAVSEVMHVTKQAIAVTNRPFTFIAVAVVLYAGVASLMMALEGVLSRRFASGALREAV